MHNMWLNAISFPVFGFVSNLKGCAFFETNNIKQLKTQNKNISRKKHVDPQKKSVLIWTVNRKQPTSIFDILGGLKFNDILSMHLPS